MTLKENKKNIRTSHREHDQSVWTFALMPALFLYLLLPSMVFLQISWEFCRKQNIISHPTQGSSCWNECKLWSGSKVFVSNHSLTEQMRAGAASLRQKRNNLSPSVSPSSPSSSSAAASRPAGHPRLPEAAWIHPITSNDDWYPWQLIISIIRWFPVGVISPLSLHVRFVRASKRSLQIGLI